MDQNTTWYLVGDASRARVFIHQRADRQLKLLRDFAHPQSRLPNQDLVTDRAGRSQQSGPAGRGTGSAMEPHTSPKAVEQEHFAHELADFLRKGLVEKEYQSLVLIAGPQFLGLLRSVLDAQVLKHVTDSLDKDYTHLNAAELEKHLATQLFGFAAAPGPVTV